MQRWSTWKTSRRPFWDRSYKVESLGQHVLAANQQRHRNFGEILWKCQEFSWRNNKDPVLPREIPLVPWSLLEMDLFIRWPNFSASGWHYLKIPCGQDSVEWNCKLCDKCFERSLLWLWITKESSDRKWTMF